MLQYLALTTLQVFKRILSPLWVQNSYLIHPNSILSVQHALIHSFTSEIFYWTLLLLQRLERYNGTILCSRNLKSNEETNTQSSHFKWQWRLSYQQGFGYMRRTSSIYWSKRIREVSAQKDAFGLRLWKGEELAWWAILVECTDTRKNKAYLSNSFVLYVFSNHEDLWTTLLSFGQGLWCI